MAGLRARDVATLYWRELKVALRERNIVVNSLLIPALLYPSMLWATFTGLAFVMGETEAQRSRDRKSTRLNSSHIQKSRMPSSA